MNLHHIGQILKKERKKQSIKVEQVAEKTHIDPSYIKAIEEGDVSKLPSKIYIKGFISSYGKYLGIETSELTFLLGSVHDDIALKHVQPIKINSIYSRYLTSVRVALALIIAFLVTLIISMRVALQKYEVGESSVLQKIFKKNNKKDFTQDPRYIEYLKKKTRLPLSPPDEPDSTKSKKNK